MWSNGAVVEDGLLTSCSHVSTLRLALRRVLITADGNGHQGAVEVHEVYEGNDGYTSR